MKSDCIDIIGMGPGNPQYIVPAATERICQMEVVIGAERHIKSVDTNNKKIVYINNNLKEIIEYIKSNYYSKKIGVLVSGDTGFYSMLTYLKNNLSGIHLNVIPGISSVSYMFGKLALIWHDAILISAHGRDVDYISIVKNNNKVAILTDKINSPSKIARELIKFGIKNKKMYIGEKLSYSDEKIICISLNDAVEYTSDVLSIVVIVNE